MPYPNFLPYQGRYECALPTPSRSNYGDNHVAVSVPERLENTSEGPPDLTYRISELVAIMTLRKDTTRLYPLLQ